MPIPRLSGHPGPPRTPSSSAYGRLERSVVCGAAPTSRALVSSGKGAAPRSPLGGRQASPRPLLILAPRLNFPTLEKYFSPKSTLDTFEGAWRERSSPPWPLCGEDQQTLFWGEKSLLKNSIILSPVKFIGSGSRKWEKGLEPSRFQGPGELDSSQEPFHSIQVLPAVSPTRRN